jgi:4-amino-4-deoxy-L-arabinose transferase-like glycosyltransferase
MLTRVKKHETNLDAKTEKLLAGLAILVVFGALCFRLGHLPLLQPDEGRNAEVAREMRESGAWLVPTYNGVDYLDKPAFYFKAVALSLACFGNSETAARIPSAAFGVGLVIMAYGFCRRVYSARCALLAVMVVATMPLFLANSRTVIFDIALAFFTCGAIFAGFLAEESPGGPRRSWYVVGAAATGFATLVKGPVGFLIPILVLLVFNGIQGRKSAFKRLFAPLNLLVFLAVTLPWFIGLCRDHPDFLHYGLVEESFHRFTTKQFHRSEPFYFFPLIVLATFYPWSILLPEASVVAWKQRWAKNPADRLCVVWSVLVVIFFSISQSKLPGYILSVTVASGMLLARLFDVAWKNPGGMAARLVARAMVIFGCLSLAGATLGAVGVARMDLLAKPLHLSPEQAVQLGRGIGPILLLLAVVGVFTLLARYRSKLRLAFVLMALYPVFLIHLSIRPLEVVFNAKSARQLAGRIPKLPPQTELAFLNCFPNGLPFYLRQTGTLITNDGGELTSNYILFNLKSGQPWGKNLVASPDFDQWLAARKHPVYLIAEKWQQLKLDQLAAEKGARVEHLDAKYIGVLLPPPGDS